VGFDCLLIGIDVGWDGGRWIVTFMSSHSVSIQIEERGSGKGMKNCGMESEHNKGPLYSVGSGLWCCLQPTYAVLNLVCGVVYCAFTVSNRSGL